MSGNFVKGCKIALWAKMPTLGIVQCAKTENMGIATQATVKI